MDGCRSVRKENLWGENVNIKASILGLILFFIYLWGQKVKKRKLVIQYGVVFGIMQLDYYLCDVRCFYN